MIFADTHVLVWLAAGDRRLPRVFVSAVESGEPLATSAVVAFEYADLHRRGRLGAGPTFAEAAEALTLTVEALPADIWHHVETLPPIHNDPIDRMLLAHAISSGAVLATADRRMRQYPVTLFW